MYGLILYNNFNQIVIDSQYRNHIYHEHNTSLLQRYLNYIPLQDPIPITSNPALFLRPSNFFVAPYGFQIGNDGTSYTAVIIASDTTGYVDWIIYSNKDIEEDDYGLSIYNENEELVFTSNAKGYLNIDTYYSHNKEGENVTVSDVDKHYFLFIGGSYNYTYSGGYVNRGMRGYKIIDNNTLRVELFTYYRTAITTGGSGFGGGSKTPEYFLAIKAPPGI